MSFATLTSDSAVSAPSRLPTWIPRFMVRAVAAGWPQPVRWPFSSSSSQGRHRILVPIDQSEVVLDTPAANNGASVVSQPSQPRQAPSEGAGVSSVSSAALSRDSLAIYNQSIGTVSNTLRRGLTLRQKLVDVLLVAMWGALIPGLMWVGATAGF